MPIQDRLVPWVNLTDVDLILLGRVSLLRILRSVISGHPKGRSVVPRSSCLPESSPRLSAPPGPAVVGRLEQFRLPQRFAVWWVALPWPILPVPTVLLALYRIVVFFWVPREEDPDGNGEGLASSAFPVSTFRMSSALDLFTTTLGI